MEAITQYVQGNPLVAIAAVFIGGLLSASSPCVLAIMPLVIGYIGGHSAGDRKKALNYSLLFALGLSITFTVLGAIAGIFGRLMGDVGHVWYWIVAALAVAMGLSLMGVFEINLPFASKIKIIVQGEAALYKGYSPPIIFPVGLTYRIILPICGAYLN